MSYAVAHASHFRPRNFPLSGCKLIAFIDDARSGLADRDEVENDRLLSAALGSLATCWYLLSAAVAGLAAMIMTRETAPVVTDGRVDWHLHLVEADAGAGDAS